MKKFIALIDIGGTYTKIKILSLEKQKFILKLKIKKKIKKKKDLFKFLKSTLGKYLPLYSAIFSMAGPVFEGKGFMTNWDKNPSISLKELKNLLKTKKIWLLNDLETQGFGLLSLKNDGKIYKNIKKIKGPSKFLKDENMALVVPGTGLGTCGIIKNNIVPMEIQHSTFFPLDKKLQNIYYILIERGFFPSYENFVSGEGLFNIYLGLKKIEKLENIKDKGDFVRKRALRGEKEAIEAIKIYFSVLGLLCQTLSLGLKPFSGIFLGGKAIKRNIIFFPKKEFLKIFLQNPKQKKLLEKIPIYFIKEELIFKGLLYYFKSINNKLKT